MGKKIKILGGFFVLVTLSILVLSIPSAPEEKEIHYGSTDTVERCNQLRDSGFYAGAGNSPGSTEPNNAQQRNQLYQDCVKRAGGN